MDELILKLTGIVVLTGIYAALRSRLAAKREMVWVRTEQKFRS